MFWLIPLMLVGAAVSYRRIRDSEDAFYDEEIRKQKVMLEEAKNAAAAERAIAAQKLAAEQQLAQQYLAMKPAVAGYPPRMLSPRMVRPLPGRKTIPNRPKTASLAGSFGHRATEDINGEDPSHL